MAQEIKFGTDGWRGIIAEVHCPSCGSSFRVEADASLPEIMADGELVGLTIRQLLTNALKYANPESPIIIKVRGIDDAVVCSGDRDFARFERLPQAVQNLRLEFRLNSPTILCPLLRSRTR